MQHVKILRGAANCTQIATTFLPHSMEATCQLQLAHPSCSPSHKVINCEFCLAVASTPLAFIGQLRQRSALICLGGTQSQLFVSLHTCSSPVSFQPFPLSTVSNRPHTHPPHLQPSVFSIIHPAKHTHSWRRFSDVLRGDWYGSIALSNTITLSSAARLQTWCPHAAHPLSLIVWELAAPWNRWRPKKNLWKMPWVHTHTSAHTKKEGGGWKNLHFVIFFIRMERIKHDRRAFNSNSTPLSECKSGSSDGWLRSSQDLLNKSGENHSLISIRVYTGPLFSTNFLILTADCTVNSRVFLRHHPSLTHSGTQMPRLLAAQPWCGGTKHEYWLQGTSSRADSKKKRVQYFLAKYHITADWLSVCAVCPSKLLSSWADNTKPVFTIGFP